MNHIKTELAAIIEEMCLVRDELHDCLRSRMNLLISRVAKLVPLLDYSSVPQFTAGDFVRVRQHYAEFGHTVTNLAGKCGRVLDFSNGIVAVEFAEKISETSMAGLTKLGHGMYFRAADLEEVENHEPHRRV